jgi:site-specific DNA-methyltransferase (adenine-specific)
MVKNQDCTDFLRECPDDYFDLIIADPPYFQIYGDFDFIWKDLNEYLFWSKTWITECKRVLKENGAFYLWGAIGYNKGYPLFKLVNWIEENEMFKVINWITQKNTRGRGNKKGFVTAREELVFMVKSNQYVWNPIYLDEPTNRKDLGFNGKPRKNKFKRCSDVWTDITEASQSSKERFSSDGQNFPTVKSLKLCERIILASSNPDDKVYIPFGGSGSEAVSCILNNREFVLTETNQSYIDQIILPRLSCYSTSSPIVK